MLPFPQNSYTYLYDGTFYGLLTIVFYCYTQKTIPTAIFPFQDYCANFIETTKTIPTEQNTAERIFHGIVKSISYDTLYNAYYAFLSNTPEKDLSIVLYLVHGFQIGPKINSMLSIPFIWTVYSSRKKMLSESHKLKGLLRFKEVGKQIYYASIHPSNNVIEDLGHHFMKRLPTQKFIIQDKNRELLFFYNGKDYRIINQDGFIVPPITEEEKQYEDLWKEFFHTISIKERSNPHLQMQFMPKKYWKDLIEMS